MMHIFPYGMLYMKRPGPKEQKEDHAGHSGIPGGTGGIDSMLSSISFILPASWMPDTGLSLLS